MSSPSSNSTIVSNNNNTINNATNNNISSTITNSSVSTNQTNKRVTFCDKVKAFFVKTAAPAINVGVEAANNIEPVIETIEAVTGHPQFIPASRAALSSINAFNSGVQTVASNIKNNTINAKSTISTIVNSTSTAVTDLQQVIDPNNTKIPKIIDEVKQVTESITHQ